MTIAFKGGRLPNNASKPRLTLSRYLSTVVSKDSVDWLSDVVQWPMYENDSIGDCTCAAAGHIIEAVSQYGQGGATVLPDDAVLKAYEDISGYDPSTGQNDNGAVMQDVLNYWRKTGIGGHKLIAFAEVDHKNLDEVYAATELFGNIYLGIDFPAFAMGQFNAGQPWDVSKNNTKIDGGHAINGGWYDKELKTWKVITWGTVQTMTQSFFDKYVKEAWVAVTPEWVSRNKNPEGIDLITLGADYESLTGEPNPFPVPDPIPTPEPVPSPTPKPDTNELEKLVEAVEVTIKKILAFLERS